MLTFIYYYYSLYAEKIPIMAALCSMLGLQNYPQNYAGIPYRKRSPIP